MTATTDQSSTRFRIEELDIFVRSDAQELITRNARCFGLESGRLDETCDLIERVFDETNGDTPCR